MMKGGGANFFSPIPALARVRTTAGPTFAQRQHKMPLLTAVADSSYGFTAQFLHAAVIFAKRAQAIEDAASAGNAPTDEQLGEHRGYVVGAIMQSTAALEAEVWNIMNEGPGWHRGSNGIDFAALAILKPIAGKLDKKPVIDRYKKVLKKTRNKTLDKSEVFVKAAGLLIRLRNELVHYKMKTGSVMKGQDLFTRLQSQNFVRPPFVGTTGVNFFPHQCLSADCARWAAETSIKFLDEFYLLMVVPCPLDGHRHRLAFQPPTIALA
jgi:hypothetical protein